MTADPDAFDLDSQVKAVKDNVIGEMTLTIYSRGIGCYMVWLYENRRTVLSDDLLGALRDDDFEGNHAGLRTLKTECVLRFMNANPATYPINYDLHRADDFEKFLLSFTNRNGGKPGQSVYDSMRSSLFHLYRGYGQSMTAELAADLTVFFKGLKRTIARRNHDAGVKLTEGKEPLSFSLLRSLCATLLKHNDEEFAFAHAFLLMSWNLMCRAGNTASIHSGHMSWDGDALAIHFGHMKNDQDGIRSRDARRVYANSFILEICPVVTMAMYASVFGISDSKIFPGSNQYDRYSKLLKRVLQKEEVTTLLANEGFKSFRYRHAFSAKGISNFCFGVL